MAWRALRGLRLMADMLQTTTQARNPLSVTRSPSPWICCLRVANSVPPSRLVLETRCVDDLLRVGNGVAKTTSLTAVGQDSLLLIRSPMARTKLRRLAHALRRPRRRTGTLVTRANASAGMTLAGWMSAERREQWLGPSVLRLLASDEGPRQIGIGWIPRALHGIFAVLMLLLCAWGMGMSLILHPEVVPWCVICVGLAVATRPDVESFYCWARSTGPKIARQKVLLVDKIRASVAPYFMTWGRKAVLCDYGMFCVVTFTDHADYVYVYLGAFSRWCLLGWYNAKDNYNFDRLAAGRPVARSLIMSS